MTKVILIFGGTGDLSRRKLFPALYNLHARKKLEDTVILACGRKELAKTEFEKQVGAYIKPRSNQPPIADFLRQVHYHSMDFRNKEEFDGLLKRINELAPDSLQTVLGYLAVPPAEFEPLVKNGMLVRDSSQRARLRLLVEKPIGTDLASSRKLNSLFDRFVGEKNVYRIDHFLAKEAVENILVMRFSNRIFEAIWDNRTIASVHISFSEKIGVENRAAFYDKTGALRDFVQSHLLQVLALLTMDEPSCLEEDPIKNAKVAALKRLAPLRACDVVMGQYHAGEVDDKQVLGYTQEPGVDPASRTETFVALRASVRSPKWKGVPFYLMTGKRLDKGEGMVTIKFKEPKACMFTPGGDAHGHTHQYAGARIKGLESSTLQIQVQPEEMFRLRFNLKTPEDNLSIKPFSMDYCYSCDYLYQRLPYEKVFEDALAADHTRFSRRDEVEMAWKWVETLKERPTLRPYRAGSSGPKAACDLFGKDCPEWFKD
ncbi:Glucose-6-phosphate 1-dehydrogenase [uncultured archaeon]|nr:Glucose-6-phosphate 1-dehydrogenase [uncultured archaeon]